MLAIPKPVSSIRPPTLTEKIIVILILTSPIMGVFFAPESYFAPQSFSIEDQGNYQVGFPFGRMVFIVILLWLIPQCMRMPRTMGRAFLRSALPLLFVLIMIASGTWTADPGQSINRSFRILIIVVFAIYLIERFDWRELVKFLTIAGSIAIVASALAAILIPQYGLSDLEGYRDSWRGALLHKNSLGALMTLLLPIAYFGWKSHAIHPRLAWFVLFGSAFVVVMSRSATSLVTYILTIVLLIALPQINQMKKQSAKLTVVALAVAAAYPATALKSLMDDVMGALGRSADFTGRAPIWDLVTSMSDLRPVWGYGSGFWSIDSTDRDYMWSVLGWAAPHAHNTLIDIRFQLGYVGLFIATLLFGVALIRVFRGFVSGMPIIALLWPTIILTSLVRGSTETYLVEPGAGGLFWFTLSYAALGKMVAEAPRRTVVRRGSLARSTIAARSPTGDLGLPRAPPAE